VKVRIGSIVNLLDTQIALVEAEEGIAIVPSLGYALAPQIIERPRRISIRSSVAVRLS
jgi:hypothetical protein